MGGQNLPNDFRKLLEILKIDFNAVELLTMVEESLRVIKSFKLNPFEKLNSCFYSSLDEIKAQFRKVSCGIRLCKCHKTANDAAEIIWNDVKELLDDRCRARLHEILQLAKDSTTKRKDKIEGTHNSSQNSLMTAWQRTPNFYSSWVLKSRELLSRAEFQGQ